MRFGIARTAPLEVGGSAPDFRLPDQNGNIRGLRDVPGTWLVLYFYPRDDTPGCTSEACALRDDFQLLRELGVAVMGVSTDDVASHRAFAEKHRLPFPLLSDPSGDVARSYGSLIRLGPFRFAKRNTFIVDPRGRVAHIYRVVRPRTHSHQVLSDLHRLMDNCAPTPGGR